MRKLPFVLYLIVAFTHLAGILLALPTLITFTKPLLLPLLAISFLWNTLRPLSAFAKTILLAFFFSWLGDVLLMRAGQTTFFLAGLGAFFLAQVSYIRAFGWFPRRGIRIFRTRPWLVLPFVLYLAAMLWMLWPGLDAGLRIPVVVYSLALVTMGIFATGMLDKVKMSTAYLLIAGAILFILSDSCIALDRFSGWSLWQPRLLIMGTYIAAQGLLCRGAIRASAHGRYPI